MLRPIPHGTYAVNDRMRDDLLGGVGGDHASNLGALIARELVAGTGKPAFIVDPVVVDEVPERVKITGLKALRRVVISHALNQIATARRYAEEHETFYESLNLIVCHMGGGITVGAHKHGPLHRRQQRPRRRGAVHAAAFRLAAARPAHRSLLLRALHPGGAASSSTRGAAA